MFTDKQSGTRHELGIIPCAVDGIFDAITAVSGRSLVSESSHAHQQDPDRAFLLRVSYLEIYNEAIRDLLNYKKADDAKVPTIKSNKVARERKPELTRRARSLLIRSSKKSFPTQRTSSRYCLRGTATARLVPPTG